MKKLIFVFGLIACVLLVNVNVQAQNRQISAQAKGAIIGAAGGALLGGILGHDLKGALLGAAIGAGGGYVVANEHNKNMERRDVDYNRGYSTGYNHGDYRDEGRYSSRAYETNYRTPQRRGYSGQYYHGGY